MQVRPCEADWNCNEGCLGWCSSILRLSLLVSYTLAPTERHARTPSGNRRGGPRNLDSLHPRRVDPSMNTDYL